MNWQDLGRTLAGIGLPTLGGALAGPMGAVAGKAIADRLGAAEASPEVIAQAIEADPDALVRLRELEVEMAKVDAAKEARAAESTEKLLATAAADVQDARKDRSSDPTRARLAWGSLILLIGTLAAYAWLAPADTQVWLLVIGAEIGWVGMTMTFYFGTSVGSAKRADEISDLLRQRK